MIYSFPFKLGAFSGASFAFFDILRDPKAMMEKSAASTAKVVRYSVCCAGFFSLYQGTRKTLKYNVKQTGEENVVTAAFISILPMGAFAMTRPLIPYCVCLVLIDAFNGVNDI